MNIGGHNAGDERHGLSYFVIISLFITKRVMSWLDLQEHKLLWQQEKGKNPSWRMQLCAFEKLLNLKRGDVNFWASN